MPTRAMTAAECGVVVDETVPFGFCVPFVECGVDVRANDPLVALDFDERRAAVEATVGGRRPKARPRVWASTETAAAYGHMLVPGFYGTVGDVWLRAGAMTNMLDSLHLPVFVPELGSRVVVSWQYERCVGPASRSAGSWPGLGVLGDVFNHTGGIVVALREHDRVLDVALDNGEMISVGVRRCSRVDERARREGFDFEARIDITVRPKQGRPRWLTAR